MIVGQILELFWIKQFLVQTLQFFHQYLIVITFMFFYKVFSQNHKVSYCSFLGSSVLVDQLFIYSTHRNLRVWRTFYNAALYYYCSVAHILGRVEEPRIQARKQYQRSGSLTHLLKYTRYTQINTCLYNESIIFGESVHDLVLRRAQKPSKTIKTHQKPSKTIKNH